MKLLSTLALVGALTAAGSAAAAAGPHSLEAAATGPHSLTEFKPGVLSVLVKVDARGKVTQVSPSNQLTPRYQRLLRENIEELVTGPAKERNKAVSSQFVLNMALKATPRTDGSYDARFTYVSIKPVPFGPMHWINTDGHQLALARDGEMFRSRDHLDYSRRFPQSYPSQYQNQRSTPSPIPSTRSATPISSNARGSSQGR